MVIDKNKIKDKIGEFLKIPVDQIENSMELKGIVPDSFMLVELLIELQEEFGIRLNQLDIEKIDTVSELTSLIAERAQAVDTIIN